MRRWAKSAWMRQSPNLRQLIGAGTPREAVAGGYGGIFVLLTPTGAMLCPIVEHECNDAKAWRVRNGRS